MRHAAPHPGSAVRDGDGDGRNEESEPPPDPAPGKPLEQARNRYPHRVFMQAARLPAAFSGIRMADETITTTGIAAHGASRLPSVEIDSFNIELKDEEGFLGDRASKGAFRDILEKWRKPLRKSGEDPVREGAIRKHQQEGARRHPGRRRHRGLGGRSQRHRGLCTGTRPRHAPLPQDQGLGEDRAHRGGRRFSRQPARRTRHRAHRNTSSRTRISRST